MNRGDLYSSWCMWTLPGFNAPATESELSFSYLNALLNPKVVPHGFPILGAGHIKQTLVNSTFHRVVENLEKLRPDEWLRTTQPREKGRLEFRSQLTARQCLIPVSERIILRWKSYTQRWTPQAKSKQVGTNFSKCLYEKQEYATNHHRLMQHLCKMFSNDAKICYMI